LLAFELQEFVVAAFCCFGVLATDVRPGFVNSAATILFIEEAAYLLKVLVPLMAQRPHFLAAVKLHEVFLRVEVVHVEMPCQPRNVAFANFNQGITATVSRTFGTIIAYARLQIGGGMNPNGYYPICVRHLAVRTLIRNRSGFIESSEGYFPLRPGFSARDKRAKDRVGLRCFKKQFTIAVEFERATSVS